VSAIQGLVNPGEEVILMEPYYDMYVSAVTLAGGIPRFVPLRLKNKNNEEPEGKINSNDWVLDFTELRGAINSKTRVLMINTPHNPVGKIFSRDELFQIAALAREHNLIVISDEVYERIVYGGNEHVRIATLPGMWDRTITVGSAGKTFSVTGWKIGWLIGSATLIQASKLAHARIAFCVATPLQEAVAVGFEKEVVNNFFEEQTAMFEKKKNYILDVFQEIGLPYSEPNGSYFCLVNTSSLNLPDSLNLASESSEETRDWKICKWLTTEIGVAAIPPSVFCDESHKYIVKDWARFCFCKTDETLTQAAERLQSLRKYLQ